MASLQTRDAGADRGGAGRRVGGWRHSLQWRLPLLISGVFVAALAAVAFAAYREVVATLERGAGERALRAAQQVAGILGTSAGQTYAQLVAAAPALGAALDAPTDEALDEARAVLAALGPSPRRRVTLWNASGIRLLELPEDTTGGVRPATRMPGPGIGPIVADSDQAFADTAVAVPGPAGRRSATRGMVGVRSQLAMNPPDALTRLIGGDARILFGNASGGTWTDMTQALDGPPVDLSATTWQRYRNSAGRRHVGGTAAPPGTPWLVWVDFPRAAAVDSARGFAAGLAVFAVALGLAVVLLTRAVLGGVTAPLAAMTTAAEAMAAGDVARQVDASRPDELGRLGRAFNAMRAEVTRELQERHRALDQLRNREEQLRHYAEHSPLAVAMFDRDMRYLVASQVWVDTYRLAGRALVGESLYEAFPNVPARWYTIHQRALAGAVEKHDGEAFPRADGTTRWVRWEVRPWREASGEVGGVIIFAEDISARVEQEAAMRTSEARYRTLFDYAPDGILIADPSGRYIDANAAMCGMLGRPREAIVGASAADVVAPDETPHVAAALQVINDRAHHRREWTFRRLDGTTFDADVFATQMPDGNVLALVRDITARNAATESVRIAEERMRFALESAGVGIWDTDYATGVTRWSEILERQVGVAPGTLPGTFEALLTHVHPDDRKLVRMAIASATSRGTDFSIEYRLVRPDGAVRWMSGAGQIRLGAHGRPVRGVGVSLDVTSRQILEAQFQQAQKMEAVGRLAGGIAHDFNNLLTAILGHCELLLDDLAADNPVRDDVAEIRRAGERAAELTRQLLAFSRKQIIQPTTIDLNDVVQGLESMIARLIGEHIHVVVSLADGPLLITADRGQIEQLIVNLAVNARDAMPKGGTLTVDTAVVDLDELYASTHFNVTPGSYVALTVTDSGTGMTPEVQAHLFEPFFTTKEPGKGTGLGLATVHGVVTRAGGSVSVYSEVDRGTSFKVYFPRRAMALSAPAPKRPRPAPGGHGRTVLVVDDADGLRTLMDRTLRRQGYQVIVAAGATEAVAAFEAQPSIDVLLTDVVMPGASGPELTAALVARRPGLKVIYMSGYTEDAIVHHGVLKPGIAFLHKPFTADALNEKIREVLAG